MRIIKFRGKRQSNNEWVFGNLNVGLENDYYILVYSETGYTKFTVNPDTIGQFTGLYDKNHKEIYEGDILEADGCSLYQKLEVRFVRGVFAFLWDGNLDDEFPTCSPTHEWAKVIGNIHDNPDLITSKIDTHKEDKE